MTKVIKGGTVCTADRAYKADVLIEDEIIKQIGQDLKGDEYIDAEGAYVIPGGIDPHTHLEMPFMGTTAAETFETGTWAAACGGTTMIVDFCLPGADGSIKNAINEWHRKSTPSDLFRYWLSHGDTDWNENVFDEMKNASRNGRK
jgi:dihydropyrimidinase